MRPDSQTGENKMSVLGEGTACTNLRYIGPSRRLPDFGSIAEYGDEVTACDVAHRSSNGQIRLVITIHGWRMSVTASDLLITEGQCSWGSGADPASQCDGWSLPAQDVCAAHAHALSTMGT